jgi:hypothetical protein
MRFEAGSIGALLYGVADLRSIQFCQSFAGFTDQKLTIVGDPRMSTADIGIERSDSVNQAHLLEKIEGAVDGRWGGTTFLLERLKNLVGTNRFVLVPDQLQNAAADVGKALLALPAENFRDMDRFCDTYLVAAFIAAEECFFRMFHRPLRNDLIYSNVII